MSDNPTRQKKAIYRKKLISLFEEYKNVLLICIDNVGSRQLQQVRMSLRGRAEFLMGKNTIIRRAIRDEIERLPQLATLLPVVRGNIGFCFTNEDLTQVRKEIEENQVPAAASTGLLAPTDVFIPAGSTGLDPGQTAFFQALNIATKISRGSIELVNQVHLVKAGERVTSSAVALLTKLGMKPFFFGVKVRDVYENGSLYAASVLDLTDDDMMNKFFLGASSIAAVSLAVDYPTTASLGHSISRGFQTFLSIGLETDYIFEECKLFKEMLDNPDAFKTADAGGAAAEEAAPVEEEEEDEEEDAGAAAALFGGDDEEEGY